jgi:hypothetical protein
MGQPPLAWHRPPELRRRRDPQPPERRELQEQQRQAGSPPQGLRPRALQPLDYQVQREWPEPRRQTDQPPPGRLVRPGLLGPPRRTDRLPLGPHR